MIKQKSVNTKRCENAHIQLSFNPDMRVTIESSEFWLEPAKDLAHEKVLERRGDVTQFKVMRERRKGEPRVLNHWRFLV